MNDAPDEGFDVDVIVVGGGNAGFCAAHAAMERGAETVVLERGREDEAGGNSFYTAGAFRVVHDGVDDLASLLADDSTADIGRTVVPSYTADDFRSDMFRLTDDRCDPQMVDRLVTQSGPVVRWLANRLKWRLMYERQAYESGGKYVFFGGLALGVVGGGKGLVTMHTEAFKAAGGRIEYGAEVIDLVGSDRGVGGVRYRDRDGVVRTLTARAVVLAAGGFESNPRMRAKYLGAEWAHALVRGTPLNTGEVLELALSYGAARHGDWSSCHSVAWDADAPPQGGDRRLTNQRTRQSYPIGVVANRDGRRFLDEGADFRNYTYAKYGVEILRQPDGIAFQLFDAKTRPMLRREEYDSEPIAMAQAGSLAELAGELGIDAGELERTIGKFNASVTQAPFDPAVKDGRAANTTPPKSNWAVEIDTPPFYGFAVRCGITFTFGGLKVDDAARVLTEDGAAIPGLYAAGELVGGLFSGNYPGGSGLTAGAVYGYAAGTSAASDRH